MNVTHVMSIRTKIGRSGVVHAMPHRRFTFCGAHPQVRHRVQPADEDAPEITCLKCLRVLKGADHVDS